MLTTPTIASSHQLVNTTPATPHCDARQLVAPRPKLRDVYRQRMNSYGIDGDLHDDETASIPFNDENVAAALAANAEGAQWGIDTGVYVPTTEEMDAADALNGAFSGVEGGYGKVNSLATARRIAEALAAYEETRKDATII